jgi:hypothetical protein
MHSSQNKHISIFFSKGMLENILKQQHNLLENNSENDSTTKLAHGKERLRRELEQRAQEDCYEYGYGSRDGIMIFH